MTTLTLALIAIAVVVVEAIVYEPLPMDKTPNWLQKIRDMVWR